MVHSQEDCPLDGSRLVFLSGSYGREGLDLSVNYCPRCDVAFVYLTPARTLSEFTSEQVLAQEHLVRSRRFKCDHSLWRSSLPI